EAFVFLKQSHACITVHQNPVAGKSLPMEHTGNVLRIEGRERTHDEIGLHPGKAKKWGHLRMAERHVDVVMDAKFDVRSEFLPAAHSELQVAYLRLVADRRAAHVAVLAAADRKAAFAHALPDGLDSVRAARDIGLHQLHP